MTDINLTKAVRQNLLSLQNTAKLMATTQNRLSTGNKVNTALDNPTNFFTASSLNARAGELDSLLDSMNNGVKTLEAADNGLTSITKTLESMQSTLRQARQDKSFETASYTMPSSSSGLTTSSQISFSGGAFGTAGAGSVKLLTDSAPSATSSLTGAPLLAAMKDGFTANKATLTSAGTAALGAAQGGAVTLTYGSDTLNVTLANNDTLAQVAAKIQTAIDGSTTFKGKVAATVDGTGHLVLAATSSEDKTISLADDGSNVNGTTAALGLATTNAKGSDGSFAFNVGGTDLSLSATDFANSAAPTLAEAVSAINVQLGNAGSKFTAEASSGSLKFSANSTSAGTLKITGEGAVSLFGASAASVGVTGTADTSIHLAKTTDDLVNEINGNSSLSTKIKASNDNGKLRLQNLSTQTLNIDGVSSSGLIDAVSTTAASIGGNTVRADLADQFNELRDQLDKIADDASFNGINILRGDKLTITFNETGTSAIDIIAKDGKSVDSNNLGVPTTVLEQDLDSDTSIDAILGKVKAAINSVRSQASTFGSNLSVVENRQNFTKTMMNTLQGGASNLTLADMNEEAANMVALQTRQSLATSSLSMANQADQNVLQLLR